MFFTPSRQRHVDTEAGDEKGSPVMWDDPNQPPAPRYPQQRPSSYGQSGGYGQSGSGQRRGGDERGLPPSGDEGWYDDSGQGAGYGQGADPGYGQQGYGQSPAYPPDSSRYPGGPAPQSPRWPEQDYPQQPPQRPYTPPQRQAYGAGAPAGQGMYREQRPAYAPAPAVERHRERERDEHHHRSIVGSALPHLPIAHVFLVGGLIAMGYAISQQWGVSAAGAPVFLKDFATVQQSQVHVDTGAFAIRAATGIVIAAAALSGVLMLFNTVVTLINKIIGVIGLSGCATLLFFPVLWGAATLLFVVLLGAAGFAGLGFLSNLPIVQSHGITSVQLAQRSIGFYLWAGGAAAAFVGMLGEVVMRRR